MKLIIGLGNPGREYSKTRHNVGFRVLDILAEQLGVAFDRNKFKGIYASATVPEQWQKSSLPSTKDSEILLVKPQTFMNLSGETAQCFCGYYKIELSSLLVVVDDVALPVGALRLRRNGSPGGHNGLKDITQRLSSQEFARLRIGVGGREEGTEQPAEDLRDHVLSRFSRTENELLKEKLKLAAACCLVWAGQGIADAMNSFNAPEKKASLEKEKM
ncbi:MAG: aminoacyl-tRNA hydrolase [Planctomycetota bacterium]